MDLGQAMIVVAGIGSRKGVATAEVVDLVARALATASLDPAKLTALATAETKAHEPGIVAAATALGVELVAVADARLASDGPQSSSAPAATRHLGLASVSEGAALAAAGTNSELVLPRIKSAMATCALATGPGLEGRR